uniref:GEO11785p1 n=1 Tax=Drosophila melanogaster TaxID=7227 RepID=C9QPH0_DROME|eukprot:NP_001162958.1 seminal fluid protein 33A2 [Drosophila melanogaster]
MHFYHLNALCVIILLDLTNALNPKEGSTFCVPNYRGWCWDSNANVWTYGR